MRLIRPSYEILESQGYLEDIERAGRTCYKSEPVYRYWSADHKNFFNTKCKEWDEKTQSFIWKDNAGLDVLYDLKDYPIKENISAKGFVDRMIKSGHGAMLEHGTVYLKTAIPAYWYKENKYSVINTAYNELGAEILYITTNYRVLVENDWLDDLQYQCEPTEFHEKRVSVRFVCDRGVSHEFVRHRVFSFAQESTRYCNYSKNKFGNELTFIQPCWLEEEYIPPLALEKSKSSIARSFYTALENAEDGYFDLLNKGWIPQQARSVLPNSLKTELVMTGFINDWKHFFELRDDKVHAHPQAYELVHPLHEEFKKLNLL